MRARSNASRNLWLRIAAPTTSGVRFLCELKSPANTTASFWRLICATPANSRSISERRLATAVADVPATVCTLTAKKCRPVDLSTSSAQTA
ncbi:hypothetical protein C3E78_02690 [Aeromicrobium chenweiae]|uniref:Uncharacterized protein n=1 Tax=Aeromicrobium chenweiae TaxID=2079793 RepID=A0A2S0WIP8_9ACTN|nr:hypothetical protein C3E78_02690 [Aeromicrobium chenweiae]